MTTSKFWAEPAVELRRVQESLAAGKPLALRFWETPDALINIRDLIVYLDAQDEGELVREDLIYLLEKPWKWEPEYEAMRAAEKTDPIAAALTDAARERMSK